MCGIAGLLDAKQSREHEELSAIARNMATSLRHRGPEDEGVWADAVSGVAFGHRRLSIIDLSAAGHQPMHSTCGRYVITYNGEIYNFKALRVELEQLGQTFRGHSDTEVMLAAITCWGVAQSLEKFNGMFAFALWDLQDKVLYLSRDRAGEKPLYYGWVGQTLLFASELKALHQYPDFRGEIDRGALAVYLRHNYIPAPHSIYKGVYKLTPERCWPYADLAAMLHQNLSGPPGAQRRRDWLRRFAAPIPRQSISSILCSTTLSIFEWNQTFRWERSFRAASTHR
jgi:asparagine synthase (glutamine-hydrolysing)